MTASYRHFRFSRSGLRGLKPSPTLSINERVHEMRAAGRDVYHLGFGESRFPVHPLIATALRENAQQRSYLPALGLPALRTAVAAFYLYPSFARWREPLAARGVETCRDLSHYLLENYDIAVLPGSTFGDDPKALAFRLSTSYLDMESDKQAQEILAAFDDDGDPDRFISNHHPRLREVVTRLADFVSELEENP